MPPPRPHVLSLLERLDIDAELTGRGVCVAFVDVGFYAHPDLLYPDKRVRAYVDVTRPEPVADELLEAHPSSWHGMMTACVACGSGYVSGGRYRGPASEADVVLVRAAGTDGAIRGANIAAAIRVPLRYPEMKIRVLNVSLGVDDDDPDTAEVERAVTEVVAAGVTVVAAAGNDDAVVPGQPGAARAAITVGGQNDKNTRDTGDDELWHSSAGGGKPDLIAPACWLPAPMLPGTLVAREALPLFELLGIIEELSVRERFLSRDGGDPGELDPTRVELGRAVEARIAALKYATAAYQHVDGTSFAAPITAAIIAQMLEACPTLGPADLRRGLLETARPLEGVPLRSQGAGVLEPRAATDWARRKAT